MPRTPARKKGTSEKYGKTLSDHDCSHTQGSDQCTAAGRRHVDGLWWCAPHAPKTVHRNCTHSLNHPGDLCCYCQEIVP